jgi:hypothetical protein
MIATPLIALLLACATSIVRVDAAPVQGNIDGAISPNLTSLEKRATVLLNAAQVASFKPYTNFAAVGGCPPATIMAWNCGMLDNKFKATHQKLKVTRPKQPNVRPIPRSHQLLLVETVILCSSGTLVMTRTLQVLSSVSKELTRRRCA